jgi:hypothetical protein
MKNFVGTIILLIGTGLTFSNIFNFSHERIVGSSGPIIAYYYHLETQSIIGIGAILIISGVLMRKK